VHLNNALGGQLPGVIAAKLLGVPCVAHLRDYETPCRSARLTAARIDHHIAISGSIKNNLLSLGVAEEKISIVHDSVELNDFSEKTKDRSIAGDLVTGRSGLLIGWFGRTIKWKGLAEFVLGLNELRKNFDDFTAVVAGDASDSEDTYYRMVRDLVRRLGLDDRIVFAGYRQDVIAVMQQMDIVVHSSISPEPFGMVIIEAMACSKPVVASAAGGGPLEIVDHGRTGYLVNVNDPAEISGALLALAKDKNLRKQLGSAGRKKVEVLFASEVHIKAIEKIYERFSRLTER
jgi:glycosyltransferase involved in cell wall biosynthesis